MQNTYKQIITTLIQDSGVRSEILAVEQFSWMLFLKFIDCYEMRPKKNGCTQQEIIRKKFRWSSWACPKLKGGKPDSSRMKDGSELIQFVNEELFPYLKEFSKLESTREDTNPKSMHYRIWNVFSFFKNRINSGKMMREVLDFIDTIDFNSESELLEFSKDFEERFVDISQSPGQANEYFTPRTLVRAIVSVISPEVGETIYDGAAGTGGFLIESFNFLQSSQRKLTRDQKKFFTDETFFGIEKSPAVYLFGLLNLISHGIEAPNLQRNSVLRLNSIGNRRLKKYDVVFANIPYNQEIKKELQQNFEIRHSAIEVLYLQHIMKSIKSKGKAAVVVPDFMLKRADNAYIQLRQELLKKFDLHTILSLPTRMFMPYSNIKSSVLFFDRAGTTSNVWYYELLPTKIFNNKEFVTHQDFEEFVDVFQYRATTDHSWMVPISEFEGDFSLIPQNPHRMQNAQRLAKIYSSASLEKLRNLALDSIAETKELLIAYLDEWFLEIKSHKVIEEFIEFTKGNRLPKGVELLDDYKGNYPYLRGVDISDFGTVSFSTVKYVSNKNYNEINHDTVSVYDLFICTSNKIGITGTVAEEVHGAVLAEDMAKITIKDNGVLDRNFLYLYTLTSEFKKQVRLSTKFSEKKELSESHFKQIEIPICPLEKQYELIYAIWDTVEEIKGEEHLLKSQSSLAEEELSTTISFLIEVKQSIQQLVMQNKSGKLNMLNSIRGDVSTFQSQVQSYFVTLMLSGGQTPCLPKGEIKEIKLNSMPNGKKIDDMIVSVHDQELQETSKLFVRICHSIEFTEKNQEFNKVIRDAWHDFNNSDSFSKGKDAIALIVRPRDLQDQYDVQWLLDFAKSSENSIEFFHGVDRSNFSPSKSEEKLDALKTLLLKANQDREISNEEIFEFLRHFHLLELDFGNETGALMTLIYTLISQFETQSKRPQDIWTRVVEYVQANNKHLEKFELEDLPNDLLEVFSKHNQNFLNVLMNSQSHGSMPILLQSPKLGDLAVLALLGSWSENNPQDRKELKRFLSMEFKNWRASADELLGQHNSPITRENGIWKVSKRDELLKQIGQEISREKLEAFRKIAESVLSKKSKGSTELKNNTMHSDNLRHGVSEGLAILSNRSEFLKIGKTSIAHDIPRLVVQSVLNGATRSHWVYLSELLPNLAEAAPEEYLAQLKIALSSSPSPFSTKVDIGSDVIAGRDQLIIGLRQSLETLAREYKHLERVCILIGKFFNLVSNRSRNDWCAESLENVFMYHLSQETVNSEVLRKSISVILKANNELCWNLLLRLLPNQGKNSFNLYMPKWRRVNISDSRVLDKETKSRKTNIDFTDLTIEEIGNHSKRLSEFVKHIVILPKSAMIKLVDKLTRIDFQFDTEEEKVAVWKNLNRCIVRHRKCAGTEWEIPKKVLNNLEKISEKFAPPELFKRFQDLFSDGAWVTSENGSNLEEIISTLHQQRTDAICEILSHHDISEIVEFANFVPDPRYVGNILANMNRKDFDNLLLPDLLTTNNPRLEEFVESYVFDRQLHQKYKWVDSVIKSTWTTKQITRFLLYLPFEKYTWNRVETWLRDAEGEYWENTLAHSEESEYHEIAVEKLLKFGRPSAAIDCLGRMLRDGKKIDYEICLKALLANLASDEEHHGINMNLTLDLIEYLQADSSVDQSRLFEVEWSYLPLFQHRARSRPITVERRLAANPEFFCEVVQLVYRSDSEGKSAIEISESNKPIVTGVHQLLKNWKELPGIDKNGKFDLKKFNKWFQKVKKICTESGHFGVALNTIGNVLIHSPVDKGGLWIRKDFASILNQRDNSDMRDGFKLAMASSQNGHGMQMGKMTVEEKRNHLQEKADSLEREGFSRFARSLRETVANQEVLEAH